jgi:hypothetical protein
MGRHVGELRRWNSLGYPLVPVAEDDREAKISPAVSPRRPPVLMPDTSDSLTCDEGSFGDVANSDIPGFEAVSSASLRLGIRVPMLTRAAPIATSAGDRKTNVSDGIGGSEKSRKLGTRSYSVGSGLSMLRARRPVPSGSDQSPYQSLMPLVLHTLGRLRYVRIDAKQTSPCRLLSLSAAESKQISQI